MYKMKKVIAALVAAAIALCALPGAVLADEQITVFIDGNQLITDVAPVVENGRVLVPMRAIFEALGAAVDWDNDSRTATAVRDNIAISITIDEAAMTKNGYIISLDVPARIVETRTMVPVRAVSEGMEAQVEWDGENNRVLITTPKKTEPEFALMPADMEALKARYNNLIRYDFEQYSFCETALTDSEIFAAAIAQKDQALLEVPYDVWNSVVISNIIQVIIASENIYELGPGLTDEALTDMFAAIVEDAGLEAHNFFEVSFETLDNGSNIMLVNFYKADTLVACKYIGLVIDKSGDLHYFTAETDIMDKNNLYFCEVRINSRGTWYLIDFDKEDFLYAINYWLENDDK